MASSNLRTVKTPLWSLVRLPANLCLVYVLVLQQALAQAGDYIFYANSGTITITGYIGSGGEVSIPDRIDGLPVANIGDFAFSDCSSLTGVTIPNSVTNIGYRAFFYCTSLTNVAIPNSITSIGNSAFWNCTNLTSVVIPDSVIILGQYVLAGCTTLTTVTLGKNPGRFYRLRSP